MLLLRLAPAILCQVRPLEAGARRHVQISLSETASSFGKEIQRHAIKRERGRAVEGRAVHDGPEIDGGLPAIEGQATRRAPQVLAPPSSRATARDNHLEPIAPDGGARVPERAAELRNQGRRAERPFFSHPRGRVDVKALVRAGWIVLHREVQGRDASRLILEVRRAGVGVRAVHHTAEVLGELPTEVVALVVTPSDEQVGETTPSPSRQARSEEHTSELQSPCNLVCRLLLEKKKHT